MTKTCAKCGETKPLEDGFARQSKSKDGRQAWCRACTREWRIGNKERNKIYQARYKAKPEAKEKERARQRAIKADPTKYAHVLKLQRKRRRRAVQEHPNAVRLREIKSGPCTDCHQCFPPEIMELDHVHGQRSFGLTLTVVVQPSVTREVFDAELAKCELRCPTCHRLRHFYARTQGRPRLQLAS